MSCEGGQFLQARVGSLVGSAAMHVHVGTRSSITSTVGHRLSPEAGGGVSCAGSGAGVRCAMETSV